MDISNRTGKLFKIINLLQCHCVINFVDFDILAGDSNKFRLLIGENLSKKCTLTYLFPMHLSSAPPENIRKPYGFLMFLGGRERLHRKEMS